LTAFSFLASRVVFELAIALDVIYSLTLVADSEVQPPVRSRKLVTTHLLHGRNSAINIGEVNKADFLTSLVLGNAGFDKAVEVFEGVGKILALEILREVADVEAAAVVLVHRQLN
jgi:hypothetical protein